MPGLNGTGPLGQGPRTGRGMGMGFGRGRGFGYGYCPRYFAEPYDTRRGAGGVATCVCPKCGYKQPHVRGIPCSESACPECGASMRGDYCMTDTAATSSKKEKEA